MSLMPHGTIEKLRIWAMLEGASLVLLIFVAMPLKYIFEIPEGVQYIGAAHGGLFIFYSMWLLVATLETKWGWQTAGICFLSAFIPAGTFWADQKFFKPYLAKSKEQISESQDS